MAENADEDTGIKISRSISVCSELPGVYPLTDGRYPAVLVLFHPTMKEMATRLVQATTRRITKLKLKSNGDVSKQSPWKN